MATEIAKAYVQIVPSMRGVKGELESELGEVGSSAGESSGEIAGNAFSGSMSKVIAIAGTAIVAAVGKVVKDSVSEFANYEQLIGGIETLFGESADIVSKNAAEAYRTAGISANQYMEQSTSFAASLMQGLGNDQAKAAEYADMAIIDMADNANKMGTSMESIQNAYQGFAKQNYTMLDNLKLGYGGTQSEMIRLINDSGILEEEISSLDGITFDQMILAIHTIQDEMGITGTTSIEASETISGSVASMKSAWQNLLTGMADGTSDFGTLASNFATTVMTAVQNIIPHIITAIGNIANFLPTLFEIAVQVISQFALALAQALPTLIPKIVDGAMQMAQVLIDNLPLFLDAGLQLILGLANGLIQAIPILLESLPTLISSLINGLLDSIPLIIQCGIDLLTALVDALPEIIDAIVAVIPEIIDSVITAVLGSIPLIIDAGIQLLISLVQALPTIISTICESIPEIIESVISAILDNIPLIIKTGIQLLVALVKGIPQVLVSVLSAVGKILSTIFSALGKAWSKMVDIGANLVRGLWQGIQSLASWLWNLVSGWVSSIWSGIKNFFGISSPSKEMAWIGEMLDQGLAEGITDNTKPITKAVSGLNDITTGALNDNIAVNGALGVSTDAQATSKLDQLIAAVTILGERLDNMQIVLDSGELVGGTSAKMNNALGFNNKLVTRGVAT